MNRQMFSCAAAVLGVAAVLALTPTSAWSESVGAAAAVKPSSTGTPPGGSSRNLEIGTDIVSRERIQTTGTGSLQVMFLDKTTLTIGPNSDLVIDEFVFKPGAGTGLFVASLSKGALRFVGGQISHNTGATITTPSATIGIRGGAALITHDSVCQAKNRGRQCTKVVCVRGDCTVESRVDSKNFRLRINQAVEIGAIGATQPFDVTSVRLNDVTKGGDAGIVGGKTAGPSATFTGQDTVDQIVSEQQQPEPIADGSEVPD